jgi:two-component system, OmpR family, phosphate regulon response regulator PhoB
MHEAQRVVLLVNGHADNRAVYRTVLEYRGYMVMEAEDGAGGLRLAEVMKPDCVVAEVTYSDDANLEFIRSLKRNDRTSDVCVIVLTASVVKETEELARQAGCTRFFMQPLEPRRLLSEVEELIGLPA